MKSSYCTILQLILVIGAPAGLLRAQTPIDDLSATAKLVGGRALPGGMVNVPLVVNANSELQAISLSLDFDEGVLQFVRSERVYRRPDGGEWFTGVILADNSDLIPGNGGVDEGSIAGGIIFNEKPDSPEVWATLPPPNVDNTIINLVFQVKPDAPTGDTVISFLDGAHPPRVGGKANNKVVLEDKVLSVHYDVIPVTVGGRIQIVGDLSLFVRGDSDQNGAVELTDVVFSLAYLYLGGPTPLCLDAADANDDGVIDITDPVATIYSLFLGSGPLPRPNFAPDADPTPDSLGCYQ